MLAFSTDHFHCFQMFILFLLTRLFAITFVVLFFYKVSPHLSVCPLFIFLEETTGTEQTPFTRLFSLLLGLFGVRVRLNNSYTFVHPSIRVCGRVNVLYPVTMKATYVLLCVGLVVLPATICQSPAERDSYTVSNCDNFSLFFCLPLQSSFMLEHEHIYLPSYVTQYIQCGIVYYQTSVCIRSHVPVNKCLSVTAT